MQRKPQIHISNFLEVSDLHIIKPTHRTLELERGKWDLHLERSPCNKAITYWVLLHVGCFADITYLILTGQPLGYCHLPSIVLCLVEGKPWSLKTIHLMTVKKGLLKWKFEI